MDSFCLLHRNVTILLLLLFVSLARASESDCPKICGICHKNRENIYEIECKTSEDTIYRLRIIPSTEIQLDCQLERSTNWSNLNLAKSEPLEGINSLSLNYCDLPNDDKKLETISRQLLTENVETFKFKSFKNLSSSIKRDHLRGFNNVKNLTLPSNNFTHLPADLIQDLVDLTKLDLRENNIYHLPPNFFTPKLREVDLSNNRIDSLAAETFKKLDKLIILNICENNIFKIFPNAFDDLVYLESLQLRGNNLENLSFDVFSRLVNLKMIDLSENNFTHESLPNKLFRENSKLEIITLIKNKRNMTSLPDKIFANLTSLSILDLRQNGFSYLPENLFSGSKNLANIQLEGNNLSTIPKNIFHDSSNLMTLNLCRNNLQNLSDNVFSSLSKLEKLDLSRNRIDTISENLFRDLSSLRELNMERNGLKTIHFLAFIFVKKLRIANFTYNELTLRTMSYQQTSPFQSCLALEELNLGHNKIDTIYEDWNINLGSLRILNLTYNRIQSLRIPDLQYFAATSKNHVDVDISYNNISYIDMSFGKSSITGIKSQDWLTISIENNPFRCDCSLYDLLRYLEDRISQNIWNAFHLKIGDLKCFTPDDYRGILITDLESKKLVCTIDSPGLPKGIYCPVQCECFLRPEDKAILTNCADKNFTKAPDKIGRYRYHHNELDLSRNFLTEIPNFNLPGYENVSTINLGYNKISNFSADKLSNNLKVLNLNNNNLTRLNKEVIELLKNSSSLLTLTLEKNPWICDCDTRDLLNFIHLKSSKLTDLLKLRCDDDDKKLISEMTPEEMCPVSILWIIGGCLLVSLIGILIGILVALCCRYEGEIKIWLYEKQWCLNFVTEEEIDTEEKRYDAFISCSPKDEEFVVNNITSKLEEDSRSYKICMQYKNFHPGVSIQEQIIRCIEESRRTIIVMTPNFLESSWSQLEFREAHKQVLNEIVPRVIVVLYGDIGPIENLDTELQTYLNINTYIKWGDPWFWKKIKYALPHSSKNTIISRDIDKNNFFENT